MSRRPLRSWAVVTCGATGLVWLGPRDFQGPIDRGVVLASGAASGNSRVPLSTGGDHLAFNVVAAAVASTLAGRAAYVRLTRPRPSLCRTAASASPAEMAQQLVDDIKSLPSRASASAAEAAKPVIQLVEDVQRVPDQVANQARDVATEARKLVDELQSLPSKASASAAEAAKPVIQLVEDVQQVPDRVASGAANAQAALDRLKAAPSELGQKLVRPFTSAAEAIANSAKLVEAGSPISTAFVDQREVDRASSKAKAAVDNLSLIPGQVKLRIVDEPIAAVVSTTEAAAAFPEKVQKWTSGAITTVETTTAGVVALPGRLANQAQNTVLSVQKFVDGVVNLPDSLQRGASAAQKRVDDTVTGVRQTATAIVGFPGRVNDTIKDASSTIASVATAAGEFPEKTKASIDNTISGVQQTVDSVVSFPGKAKATIDGTIDSVKQSVDAVVGFPAKTKATIDDKIIEVQRLVQPVGAAFQAIQAGASWIMEAATAKAVAEKPTEARMQTPASEAQEPPSQAPVKVDSPDVKAVEAQRLQ